jgi:hypothetical protein
MISYHSITTVAVFCDPVLLQIATGRKEGKGSLISSRLPFGVSTDHDVNIGLFSELLNANCGSLTKPFQVVKKKYA